MNDDTPNTSYDPQGKAHWLLSQMERGPRDVAALYDDADAAYEAVPARKMRYVLAALCVSGLVRRRAGNVEMTRKGHYALRILDRGQPYVMDRVIRIGEGRRPRAAA